MNLARKMLVRAFALLAAALTPAVASAGPILINFQSQNGTYATDGTNTWQTFNYDQDGNGEFDSIASTILKDTSGANTSITFALTPQDNSIAEFSTTGDATALANDKPANGFDWFDETVAEQIATSAINENEGSGNHIQYTFGGFNEDDEVTFRFVISRGSTGTRRLNFWDVAVGGAEGNDATNILTAEPTNGVGLYITYAVTGATSYSFRAEKEGTDSAAAVVNAMQISIVPEPASLALMGLGSLLILGRRRVA